MSKKDLICYECTGDGVYWVPNARYEGNTEICHACNGTGEQNIIYDEDNIKMKNLIIKIYNNIDHFITVKQSKNDINKLKFFNYFIDKYTLKARDLHQFINEKYQNTI